MTSTPIVSVITPIYNLLRNGRKQFFLQMMNSVRMQSYPRVEHILIDGASNDGTLELLKELSTSHSFSYISEKDSGIYDAMNKGIDRASGKYILILNSDDFFITQEAIQETVCLLENTKSDYAYANCLVEDNGDSLILSDNMKYFWRGMPFSYQTMMCKKELLLRFSKFDTSFSLAADYDFILKCILHDVSYCYLPQTISAFRTGGASGENHEKSLKDQLRAMMKECSVFFKFKSEEEAMSIFVGASSPTKFLRAMKSYMEAQDFHHYNVRSMTEIPCVKRYLLFGLLPLFKTNANKKQSI